MGDFPVLNISLDFGGGVRAEISYFDSRGSSITENLWLTITGKPTLLMRKQVVFADGKCFITRVEPGKDGETVIEYVEVFVLPHGAVHGWWSPSGSLPIANITITKNKRGGEVVEVKGDGYQFLHAKD